MTEGQLARDYDLILLPCAAYMLKLLLLLICIDLYFEPWHDSARIRSRRPRHLRHVT